MNPTHLRARRTWRMAWPGLFCLMSVMGAMSAAQASELPALIRDALNAEPTVLEALANEAVSGSRLKSTEAQHAPVFGLTTSSTLADPNRSLGRPFRGLNGRLNLFAAGAIDSAVGRDQARQQSDHFKVEQTREQVALDVTTDYLQAMGSDQLLQVEQQNLLRHEKIVHDLQIIVDNDPGRRFELVQAQSRALQVSASLVEQEKAKQIALSRLSRYTQKSVSFQPQLWAQWQPGQLEQWANQPNPAIEALQSEAQAVRLDRRQAEQARWPRIDLEVGAGNYNYARVVTNWSFFDRSADYSVQSAANQIIAAEQRVERMRKDLAQQARTAQTDREQSLLQIQATARQIASSAEVAKLYELQFKVGRRSLIELVNAYAELASVERAHAIAQGQLRAATAAYLTANAALLRWALAQP